MHAQPRSAELLISRSESLQYLVYLPKAHDPRGDQKWPLILFLHGAGERGNNLDQVKLEGLPKRLESEQDFPFIVVAPQCPERSFWTLKTDALMGLLDKTLNIYAADRSRVYLTGLSMGGFGSWNLAILFPRRFAAVAPICGAGLPLLVENMKDVPTWVFHGAKDDTVPLERSEEMVEALKECGANVKFTVYPEAGHDSWTETYNNPELYEWFLQYTLPPVRSGSF